jgi:hypothetical protein
LAERIGIGRSGVATRSGPSTLRELVLRERDSLPKPLDEVADAGLFAVNAPDRGF